MNRLLEATREVVKYSTQKVQLYNKELIKLWHQDPNNWISLNISINRGEFSGVTIYHKSTDSRENSLEVCIGNFGIFIHDTLVHNIDRTMMSEEQYFQFSLLNDLYGFEYQDYVDMVNFQTMLNKEFPGK